MQEQNPYAPPESNLETSIVASSNKKTIEEALASDYDFSIGEILSNAWAATKGFKMHTFLVILIIFALGFIVGMIEAFLPETMVYVTSVISGGINAILFAGLYVLTLKYLRGDSISFSQDFFSVFTLFTPLLLAYIVTILLTGLGFMLLIIPGIYLSIAYGLTFWIILDHPNINFWDAMEVSRKLISKRWFKVFGLYLMLSIIVVLSMIPALIGLIWTIPLSVLAMGILYRTIFGEIK